MCTDVPDAVRDLASRLQYTQCISEHRTGRARGAGIIGSMFQTRSSAQGSTSSAILQTPWFREKDSVSILSTFLPQERPDFSKRSRELLSQAVSVGLIAESDILFTHEQIIEYGFPIPLLDTRRVVDRLLSWLSDKCVFSVGRYGEWSYMGIEHAIMTGMGIDRVLTRGRGRS